MLRVDFGEQLLFQLAQRDPVPSDTLEALRNILQSPLPVLPLAVVLKEWLQPLDQVPLQIVGQHTDNNVTANPVVVFMIHSPQFQRHSLQVEKGVLDQTRLLVDPHQFGLLQLFLAHVGPNPNTINICEVGAQERQDGQHDFSMSYLEVAAFCDRAPPFLLGSKH